MANLSEQVDMIKRTCGVPECTKPHRARGLCSTHYNQSKPDRHAAKTVACCICGDPCLKTNGYTRTVCSYACRWYLQHEQHSSPVWFATCDWCSTLFASRTADSTWCSDRCSTLGQRTIWPTCHVHYETCVQCGHFFATPYATLTCSAACAKEQLRSVRRDAKHRRRVLERSAFIESVPSRAIHDRDRWTCHICKKKVRRNAVVPDPLAPTLDHVVPLAEGGTHERANVRTAHFICNSLKSNGYVPGGEQLLLIG